jgi:hypothetical protein
LAVDRFNEEVQPESQMLSVDQFAGVRFPDGYRIELIER